MARPGNIGTQDRSFPEEVVVEIISYLPPEKASQCKLLSKSLKSCLSDSHFSFLNFCRNSKRPTNLIHCSTTRPVFYANIPLDHRQQHAVTNRDPSIRLPLAFFIADSCNGLLLIRFESLYCILNPMTSTYRFIKAPNIESAGLAVEINNSFSSTSSDHYKLVTVFPRYKTHENVAGYEDYDCRYVQYHKQCPRFDNYEYHVFSPVGNTWKRLDGEISSEGGGLIRCQPVYLHGCLHWIRMSGDILCFNVKREREQGLIEKPPGLADGGGDPLWLGLALGTINIVVSTKMGIVIHELHDYENREWRIRARIENTVLAEEDHYKYGTTALFDGERLFLQLPVNGTRDMYMYHMQTKSWKMFWAMPEFVDLEQHFVPFVPSLAKVSTVDDENSEFDRELKKYLDAHQVD